MEKQISEVLTAVRFGCDTSDQVAAMTGLTVAAASSYLSQLATDGLIRVVEREGRRFNNAGRASHVYAPR